MFFMNVLLSFLDKNECLSSPCHPDAVCTNQNPFYKCTCKTGYAGDGVTCTGKLIFFNVDITDCSI